MAKSNYLFGILSLAAVFICGCVGSDFVRIEEKYQVAGTKYQDEFALRLKSSFPTTNYQIPVKLTAIGAESVKLKAESKGSIGC